MEISQVRKAGLPPLLGADLNKENGNQENVEEEESQSSAVGSHLFDSPPGSRA